MLGARIGAAAVRCRSREIGASLAGTWVISSGICDPASTQHHTNLAGPQRMGWRHRFTHVISRSFPPLDYVYADENCHLSHKNSKRQHLRRITSSTAHLRNMTTSAAPADRLDTPQFREILTPELLQIGEVLNAEGFEVRLVGGVVRDLLLGNAPKDIDLATPATPEEVWGVRAVMRIYNTLVVTRSQGYLLGKVSTVLGVAV